MKSKSGRPLSKTMLILTGVWLLLIFAIGIWWLYLIGQMGARVPDANAEKLSNMLLWEGGFFFLLLLLLSGTLASFYLRLMRQTRSMQHFFLSLTHELKTPLASIRLQAEVLQEKLGDMLQKESKTGQVLQRLLSDTMNLETKMDKILQLSQVERESDMNLRPIDVAEFFMRVAKRWLPEASLNIKLQNGQHHVTVMADEFALELVLRNLLENSDKHANSKDITISISATDKGLWHIAYQDHGLFKADPKKMGEIFYKYQSSRGTGIGLYLCRHLMRKMGGELSFELDGEKLIQVLTLPQTEVLQHD